MERATKTRLTFESGGETLVGDLYLPRDEPAGVVVAVGPLTSVKEQASGAYARAMAERGYAGLAFDYRYFGESGGTPRQRTRCWRRPAVAFAFHWKEPGRRITENGSASGLDVGRVGQADWKSHDREADSCAS